MTVPIASIIRGNVSEANEKEKEVKLKKCGKVFKGIGQIFRFKKYPAEQNDQEQISMSETRAVR